MIEEMKPHVLTLYGRVIKLDKGVVMNYIGDEVYFNVAKNINIYGNVTKFPNLFISKNARDIIKGELPMLGNCTNDEAFNQGWRSCFAWIRVLIK